MVPIGNHLLPLIPSAPHLQNQNKVTGEGINSHMVGDISKKYEAMLCSGLKVTATIDHTLKHAEKSLTNAM